MKNREKGVIERIDALVASYVYGLGCDEFSYILDTFPILKRRDEEQFDEFRTKRLILQAFDNLSQKD